ncbi:uncharacterized protein LOC132258959 [Phlebotomus argentipes]|uniref:uncharacterized protein LOC132258959 n=1 Tax=Phlebotomus argentipes TaxID=94469 RepID=UPI0028937464|nr:uncharacterized protein LOC132258959 [Phlebotomus argentipes]
MSAPPRITLSLAIKNPSNAAELVAADVVQKYEERWNTGVTNCMELFFASTGREPPYLPFLPELKVVYDALDDGSIEDLAEARLQAIERFADEKYIFNCPEFLKKVQVFFTELLSTKYTLVDDEKWVNYIVAILQKFSNYESEYTTTVAMFYYLLLAKCFETNRVQMKKGTDPNPEREEYFKRHLLVFLSAVPITYGVSRPAMDILSNLALSLFQSDETFYVLENCQLHLLINLLGIQHKSNKDVLHFLELMLGRASADVKKATVEYLGKHTKVLTLLLFKNESAQIQIAAIKLTLACQRVLANKIFLTHDETMQVYNKMCHSNNNMRELAKKFFILTHNKTDALVKGQTKTILEALIILITKKRDCMDSLSTIISLMWKNFPKQEQFIHEVCNIKGTDKRIAFKIHFLHIKKVMEPDVEIKYKRDAIESYLSKINMIIKVCDTDQGIFEIIVHTLLNMDLKTHYTPAFEVQLKTMVDFLMRKLLLCEFMPTLYLVNLVLRKIAEFNDYTKDRIKKMILDMSQNFIREVTGVAEDTALQLSAALYIHNVLDNMTKMRMFSLLGATKHFLDYNKAHTLPSVHHVFTIHAELLSAKWTFRSVDDEDLIREMEHFLDTHITPYMLTIEGDPLINLEVMQSFSVVITNFVSHAPTRGYAQWNLMQDTLLGYVQEVAFSMQPEETTSSDGHVSAPIPRTILETLLNLIECVQNADHQINKRFAKIIFLLAKSLIYPDLVHKSLEILFKLPKQFITMVGAVCHSFTFYPEEKTFKQFLHSVEDVLAAREPDQRVIKGCRIEIVEQYIQNVGRYITYKYELEEKQKAAEAKQKKVDAKKKEAEAKQKENENRLGVMKAIKDLVKSYTAEELNKLVETQQEYICQDYLNAKEKEILKSFVKFLKADHSDARTASPGPSTSVAGSSLSPHPSKAAEPKPGPSKPPRSPGPSTSKTGRLDFK